MGMKLRALPASLKLTGKRVLVRVDWNVPKLHAGMEDSLRITRSLPLINDLSERGATVILLTHLGRPTRRDLRFSTRPLSTLLKRQHHLSVTFHPESVSDTRGRKRLQERLADAEAGSVHLLENVRFEPGEDKNDHKLAKAYAELGDIYINDAFGASHRAHTSIVALAKTLPTYAGPALAMEVEALSRLLNRPSRPFVAILGGFKLSTKLPLLGKLLRSCDQVMVGGAMAATCLAAKGIVVGASLIERPLVKQIKTTVSSSKLILPIDVKVRRGRERALYRCPVDQIEKGDVIVDVGPATLAAWAARIKKAKTIMWNGPVGISEETATGAGTRFLARAIAARAKGPAFGVAGGGDTLPVIAQTRTADWFDHLSTGGGAMLAFVTSDGKLPGLEPLHRT